MDADWISGRGVGLHEQIRVRGRRSITTYQAVTGQGSSTGEHKPPRSGDGWTSSLTPTHTVARGRSLTMGAVKGRRAGKEEKSWSVTTKRPDEGTARPTTRFPASSRHRCQRWFLLIFIFLIQIITMRLRQKFKSAQYRQIEPCSLGPLAEGSVNWTLFILPQGFNTSGYHDL